MFVSMVFSFTGWFLFDQYIQGRGVERFDDAAKDMRETIAARMLVYEQVLRSGVGLFKASESVTREEWRRFADNVKLQQYYPGIQGLGFSKVVPASKLTEFEQSVRDQGFPNFKVTPVGTRDYYHAIVFLEPFDWRNQRAFGYDMYTEPRRRKAMDWAITTGNAAISAKITLVQETHEDIQAGFLMYLPLYKGAAREPVSVEGLVYAAFRMEDLMRGIIGTKFPKLILEVYDGGKISVDALMFRSSTEGGWRYQSQQVLELGGHSWLLNMGSIDEFITDTEKLQSRLMLFMAVVFELLTFYFLLSIARTRQKEVLLADEVVANERRFRLVVEASPSALIIADSKGIITLVNIHTEQLFGYSRDELLGQSVNMLLPAASRSAHHSHMASYLANPIAKKMSVRDELYGRTKQGRLVPIEVGLTPIHFSTGISVLATINDISVRRNIEAQRLAHTRELERINKELDNFTHIASHDLKSPLRGIDQLSMWLEEDLAGKLDETSARHLALIRSRIARMTQLLDGLLFYSRIGRIEDALKPIELCELVRDTFALVAPPSGFELKLDAAPLPLITAREPLELVLRNLFSNAIKHHDRGAGEISVSWNVIDGMVEICVADDGPGIPKEYQEKVFNIFQTLKTRDEVEGCGLGLSLVKKTVERYGGKVWLVSEGRGCQFWFSWPEHMEASK
ncbi:CHASE domain-containing protein [Shewanella sp. JM162201]|uniref:histidine kinase n=1 Tax=Shewanella jiangmenensis TaxID=2837387 RepID=A0ABS5V389_9GAMM|nr:CHASE domain-containing protein [Shewanella jiangmenensis]